jgi:hypothetical protein
MRSLSYLLASLLLAILVLPTSAATRLDGITAVSTDSVIDRRKPRIPGGSGCDDPDDIIEHPECTP